MSEQELREQIAKLILDFDCPNCVASRCLNDYECRTYAQGRQDAAAIVLGQQSTPIVTADE
jgi:hypothetical protein